MTGSKRDFPLMDHFGAKVGATSYSDGVLGKHLLNRSISSISPHIYSERLSYW